MSFSCTKIELLKEYRFSDTALADCDLDWELLLKIGQSHEQRTPSLLESAVGVVKLLQQCDEVHSVRYRVKDPKHLMAKIIRKRLGGELNGINVENYSRKVTDLVGVRALHLFKVDWDTIDKFVRQTWKLKETPRANYREGDPKAVTDGFKHQGCKLHKHKSGYRSVHYLLSTSLTRVPVTVELQVRTIFEEAWSEIDHRLRYPIGSSGVIVDEQLNLLNIIAGSADQLGSMIQFSAGEMVRLQKEVAVAEPIPAPSPAVLQEKRPQGLQAITELQRTIPAFDFSKWADAFPVSKITLPDSFAKSVIPASTLISSIFSGSCPKCGQIMIPDSHTCPPPFQIGRKGVLD